MRNQFLLELDTTGPDIEVHAPAYTTNDSFVEILLVANEKLSTYQDFYFLDSESNRHNVVFDYQGDRFVGQLRFTDFPTGMATFYATVKDEVLNESAMISYTIKISEQANIAMKLEAQSRKVKARDQTARLKTNANSHIVIAKQNTRKIEVEEEYA